MRWELYPLLSDHERARAWLSMQHNLRLAPNTVEAYARSLEDYLSFCERKGIEPEGVGREQIGLYVGDLASRPNPRGAKVLRIGSGAGLSNATMQLRLTAVRLFYDHLIEQGLRKDNPLGRGRYAPGKAFAGKRDRGLVRRYRTLPWIPGDEEWRTILQAAREEPIRNRLMLLLSYDVALAATGETLKKDTICLLDVPTNKTATAFTKPVHPIIEQRIAEWERKRPAEQPTAVDRKTAEQVHFLFSVRNRPVARAHLNNCLIPLLCRKAGMPESDSRGKLTSHRARATIASQLYNGPEPLSLTELQQWLGHKDPKSTQSYARIDPTRLAKKYADSGYLERNMALIEVLLDVEALKADKSDAALYYEMGHGLCSNPYWHKCPYRMACVRCEFYVAGEQAQYVRAKKGVRRMLEQIPLTDEERRAAEGDERALDELLKKNADAPTPAGPTPRELGLVPLSRKPTREAGHST